MDYLNKTFIFPSINKLFNIWNHNGFQKYLKNTGWMFFGRVFLLLVSFSVSIYIARYLGPVNYGLFNYVISFVGLFGFLSSLGLDSILNRELVKNHERKDVLIGTSFYLKLAGSVLTIAIIFIVSIISTDDKFTLLLIWLFSLNYIPQAFNVIEIYFQSQILSKKVVIAQTIAGMISAILKLLLIFLNKGIFWLITIYVLETFIIAFILLIYFKDFGRRLRKWRFDLGLAKELLKDSWPLILSSVAIGVYMKIDQVMIKNMLSDEQVGLYAVAVKLSEIWYFIPSIVLASVFPALVNSYKKNEDLFNKRIGKLYFLMFWVSFLIAICTTFLADSIIQILFGDAYTQSVLVLRIYIWSGVFVFIGSTSSEYLLIKNYTQILFYNTLLGAFLNIILNLFLITKFNIIGASISTVISYFIATFSILFYKKTKKQGLLIISSIIRFKNVFTKIKN